MKKIKLLSSLITLGLVATATPIIATSCSSTYTMSGLNWDKAPTVGTTSTPNQWYVSRGNEHIASHDNRERITSVVANKSTSEDLNFKFDETTKRGTITPTESGNRTLALDFTLNDGTKFTVSTTVVVNTNYPWTVTKGDNCEVKDNRRVEITDKTQAATLNISIKDIPEKATYEVNTTNQEDKKVSLEFENGVLTIPANTIGGDNDFIVCSIHVKSGHFLIGEALFLNITDTDEDIDADQGLLTFNDWTNDKGTGVLDYLAESHFPAEVPDNYKFEIDYSTKLKGFIYYYVSAGMVAEGLMHYVHANMGTDKLKDALVSWKTTTNNATTTLIFNATFATTYELNGEHHDWTCVLHGTIDKTWQEPNGNVTYNLLEVYIDDGNIHEYSNSYSSVNPEASGMNPYAMLNGQNPQDENWGAYYSIAFISSNWDLFYLTLPIIEFNDGKGLPSVGSYIFNSVADVKKYASDANFPVESTWDVYPIDTSTGLPTQINTFFLNGISGGILGDGLVQEAARALDNLPEGVEIDTVSGYVIWSASRAKISAAVSLYVLPKEGDMLMFAKSITLEINSSGPAISKIK
ncbi:MAG: hypothetical protein HUJ52_01755, partial [Malacoplasma sp.]|nr:hypothetical protein [Malacoplasma sp.]